MEVPAVSKTQCIHFVIHHNFHTLNQDISIFFSLSVKLLVPLSDLFTLHVRISHISMKYSVSNIFIDQDVTFFTVFIFLQQTKATCIF